MRKFNSIVFGFIFSISFLMSAESQALDRGMFKSSSMVSLETAKKEMKQVYPNLCDMAPERFKVNGERKILKWVRAMPVSAFAGSMNCWEQLICTRSDGSKFKGVNCCSNISPKFKLMESDMHNLIPTFDWILETKNDSYESVHLGGVAEYKHMYEWRCHTKRTYFRGSRKFSSFVFVYVLSIPDSYSGCTGRKT